MRPACRGAVEAPANQSHTPFASRFASICWEHLLVFFPFCCEDALCTSGRGLCTDVARVCVERSEPSFRGAISAAQWLWCLAKWVLELYFPNFLSSGSTLTPPFVNLAVNFQTVRVAMSILALRQVRGTQCERFWMCLEGKTLLRKVSLGLKSAVFHAA